MSSDSSSSDSEEISGDEELDNNILKAFQAVKCNLTSAGVKRNETNHEISPHIGKHETTSTNPISTHKASSSIRHKLIYQTFQRGIVNKKSNKKYSVHSEHEKISDGNKEISSASGSFFIDKGPSCSAGSDDVVAYDFTNIEDTVNSDSEDEESENVVAFDLTNIDGSAPDSVTLNCGVNESDEKDTESENKLEDHDPPEYEKIKKEEKNRKRRDGVLSSHLQADVEEKDVYINVNPLGKSGSNKMIGKQRHKEPEIMKKSVITEDFERQESVQTTHVSVRQQKKQRKLEREKTKGDKWFNMPATELTDERKYDLQVIQMRKALDPKRFYKAHDLKSTPKYFQFGQVVEDATDFYSSRIPKKQRKSTVVEELLADAEFRKFNKRKYEEVQEAKRQGKGPYKHMKRLKKRKK